MNPLKQILKWTLIFLLSFTTFNFFISGKIEVSIEIEAPVVIVYEKVTDLQTWPTWAPWWKKDSTMSTGYSGQKSGLGAKMSGSGVDGGGILEIVEANFAKNLKNELFFEGMPPSYRIWTFQKIDKGTRVTWSFQDELPFYVHFMQLFISPELKSGLLSLKQKCESMPNRTSEVVLFEVSD
jgi:hypothetical protein